MQITDIYGRTIGQAANETWTNAGVTVGPCSAESALATFNGMAPAGWTPPPRPIVIPASATNAQIRTVLLDMPSPTGTANRSMWQDVNDAATAAGEHSVLFQMWNFANDFERSGDLVQSLATKFGLTSAQLDDLFTAAVTVSA